MARVNAILFLATGDILTIMILKLVTLVLIIVSIVKIVDLAHAILMVVPLPMRTIVRFLAAARSVLQIALVARKLGLFAVTLKVAYQGSISTFRRISVILVLITAQLARMLAGAIAILEVVTLSILITQQLSFVTQYVVQIATRAIIMAQ